MIQNGQETVRGGTSVCMYAIVDERRFFMRLSTAFMVFIIVSSSSKSFCIACILGLIVLVFIGSKVK